MQQVTLRSHCGIKFPDGPVWLHRIKHDGLIGQQPNVAASICICEFRPTETGRSGILPARLAGC